VKIEGGNEGGVSAETAGEQASKAKLPVTSDGEAKKTGYPENKYHYRSKARYLRRAWRQQYRRKVNRRRRRGAIISAIEEKRHRSGVAIGGEINGRPKRRNSMTSKDDRQHLEETKGENRWRIENIKRINGGAARISAAAFSGMRRASARRGVVATRNGVRRKRIIAPRRGGKTALARKLSPASATLGSWPSQAKNSSGGIEWRRQSGVSGENGVERRHQSEGGGEDLGETTNGELLLGVLVLWFQQLLSSACRRGGISVIPAGGQLVYLRRWREKYLSGEAKQASRLFRK
jgi:hypothetical protein